MYYFHTLGMFNYEVFKHFIELLKEKNLLIGTDLPSRLIGINGQECAKRKKSFSVI